MRQAVVLDVSHKPAGAGVTGDDLERTGVGPAPGQIAVIKTLWTDRAFGKPEFWNETIHLEPSVGEWMWPRRGGRGDGLFPGKAVLADDADAGRARRQSQALAKAGIPMIQMLTALGASAAASRWSRCRCGCMAWTARPPA